MPRGAARAHGRLARDARRGVHEVRREDRAAPTARTRTSSSRDGPNATLEAAGKVVHFNARGQRATNVRDLAVPKPRGRLPDRLRGRIDDVRPPRAGRRVDLAGAPRDRSSRRARRRRERRLPGLDEPREPRFPRDPRPRPRPGPRRRLFGVNDLQPAGHVPFHPDYCRRPRGHPAARSLGVAPVPVRLVSRSVFLESFSAACGAPGGAPPAEGFAPPRVERRPEARRHSRGGGGRLRAQPALDDRRRARTRREDAPRRAVVRVRGPRGRGRRVARAWTPGLTPAGYLAGLATTTPSRASLRRRGRALPRPVRGGGSPSAFADPVHFTPEGSERFARALRRRT